MQAASSRPDKSDSREREMARKVSGPKVDRRKFLTGVAVAGAASAVTPHAASANTEVQQTTRPSALPPSAQLAAAEAGTPQTLARTQRPDGSDFMVDVIKTLDIEY